MEEYELMVDNEKSYNKNGKNVVFGLFCTAVVIAIVCIFVFAIPSGDRKDNYLNYNNYSKIQTGMSYSEVKSLLGGNPGELTSSSSYGGYTLSYYSWSNWSGTICIVVGFENGRVCAKSQFGL